MAKLEGAGISGNVVRKPVISVDIITEDPEPRDGVTIFGVGNGVDPTGWNLSGASYDNKTIDVTNDTPDSRYLFISPDGVNMYVLQGLTNATVDRYILSTPDDISTGIYHSTVALSNVSLNPGGFWFKADGTQLWVTGLDGSFISRYDIPTAWDITSISGSTASIDISAQTTFPRACFLSDDGKTLYILGQPTNTVYQYSMTVAYDLTTLSYASKSFSVATQDGSPFGMFFKSDFTKMYISGDANDKIYQYTLSTAGDISTTSFDGVDFSVSAQIATTALGLYIKTSNGLKMYVHEFGTDEIFQYSLTAL